MKIHVPTLDLQNINEQALKELDKACIDHGFFKVKNHGLNDLIDDLFIQTKAFFDAPREFKNQIRRTATSPFGYFDKEITKHKRDLKEVFDYCDKNITDNPFKNAELNNYWPKNDNGQLAQYGLEEFEATLKRFYQAQTQLGKEVLGLVCKAMGADVDAVDDCFGTEHSSLARLNHYPSEDPVPQGERDENVKVAEIALGAHTDPNAVTLLYQDNTGGLQALSTEFGWIDVPPEEYTFVINIGDIVQAWSNDRYKAAVHRVKKIPSNTSRYSTPYFYMPKEGTTIKPVIGVNSPKYREFSWDEYIKSRIDDNYALADGEEMQVTDYRI